MATFDNGPASDDIPTEGHTQASYEAAKREARGDPANQNPARSNTNMGPTSSSTKTTTTSGGARTIVGLMGVTVVFATIGHALSNPAPTAPTKGITAVTSEGKIILGGFFATALLVLLAQAGDQGRQFATGLALVTCATATLVYGGPVWKAASGTFGSQPTAPSTSSTKPTTPTQGVQTAVALTQAA